MAFDKKKFLRTKWQPREEAVNVPDMKDFFSDDEKPEWKVKGLTGQEFGRCKEAGKRNKSISAIVDGLVSTNEKEKADAIKKIVGMGSIPEDVAERIEILVLGSIEPKVDFELARIVCKAFPSEFYLITNKIMELSGKGHEPGKPQASGDKRKSKTA